MKSTFVNRVVLFVFMIIAVGCSALDSVPTLEERAQEINKSLICPVCPGETIDQSRVQLAEQMRKIVRDKVELGYTKDDIQRFFVERYGDDVLAEPPMKGFSLTIWVVPPLVVIGGGILLFFILRSMATVKNASGDKGALVEHDLKPYLSLVDEELSGESILRRVNKKTTFKDHSHIPDEEQKG